MQVIITGILLLLHLITTIIIIMIIINGISDFVLIIALIFISLFCHGTFIGL